MAGVASPRQKFRSFSPVPLEEHKNRDAVNLMGHGLRQAQEILRKHPVQVVSTTANYTMSDWDMLIKVDATDGPRTVTLLTAAARECQRVVIKKIDSSTNVVTIDPEGSETIDGLSIIGIGTQYAARELISDGVNWCLITPLGTSQILNATGITLVQGDITIDGKAPTVTT